MVRSVQGVRSAYGAVPYRNGNEKTGRFRISFQIGMARLKIDGFRDFFKPYNEGACLKETASTKKGATMENENKTVETVVEENVETYDKSGVGTEILGYLKNNWWKGLIALLTTAGSFAGGVLVGSQLPSDIQKPEPAPELPFETTDEI